MSTLSIQLAAMEGALFASAGTRITIEDFAPIWHGPEAQGKVLALKHAPRAPRKARLRVAMPANDNMAPLP